MKLPVNGRTSDEEESWNCEQNVSLTENSDVLNGAMTRGFLSCWISVLIMDRREMRLLHLEML